MVPEVVVQCNGMSTVGKVPSSDAPINGCYIPPPNGCYQSNHHCSHRPGPLGQSCRGYEREGQADICKTVARYAAIEKLYFRQSSSVDKMLEDSIVATYASILRSFFKCRRHFDLGLARRIARYVHLGVKSSCLVANQGHMPSFGSR